MLLISVEPSRDCWAQQGWLSHRIWAKTLGSWHTHSWLMCHGEFMEGYYLDHEEGKATENWCFWTVVLEKTLESPLDSKETRPVNLKGNQYFCHLMSLSRVWLFETPWTAAHPGFLVLHHLPELAQTHVYWVGDAIQPSHPLSSPSSSAFNISQQQVLFQWVSSSYQVAKVLELQHQMNSMKRQKDVTTKDELPRSVCGQCATGEEWKNNTRKNEETEPMTETGQWCCPNISSSVIPFSSCLQSFPALGSFSMSQFFASGGQSIGVSASASVLPMNIQDWFPLGWTGWMDLLAVQGTLKGLLPAILILAWASSSLAHHMIYSA